MNKKGFTLIEIIAILAVLGIMVILIFPNLGGSINEKKEKELEKMIGIIESAGKAYFSFNDDVYKVDLNKLIDDEYITTEMVNPNTGELLDGCIRKTLDGEKTYVYVYGSCETINVPFSAEMNGGIVQTFQTSYQEFTKIDLIEPTHEKADFKGWEIVKGNSTIKNNTLIIGTTETILYANWDYYPELNVDLDGGIDKIDYNEVYKSGTIITLEEPTKAGYKFTGWTKVSGNSIISGNTLTMGTKDTKIKANWKGPESFEEDDWSIIVSAVQSGTYPYEVGDTKKVDLGDLGIHTIRVSNITPCDGMVYSHTACGFVLEFADIITTHVMNDTLTNQGGWPQTQIRRYINNEIYNSLPTDLKNGIINTNVVSVSGTSYNSSVEKLYLLSPQEVYGVSFTNEYNLFNRSRQLDWYYENETSIENYKAAIKLNGSSAGFWWLRSPSTEDSSNFYTIYTTGNFIRRNSTNSYGVSPAFKIN